MALPSMFNTSVQNELFSEAQQKALIREVEQQAADVAATGSNVEGEGGGREDGTPGGILRDPWVQRGLALIIGAFVGGGIAYVVFGRKE